MSTNEQTPLESFIEHKAQTGMQCGNYSIDIPKPKEELSSDSWYIQIFCC